VRTSLARLRGHPRHLVLASLVAGLLAGSGPPWLPVPVAAGTAALAGRPGPALAAAAAALSGSALADARLSAIDHTDLRPSLGRTVAVRAVALEEPRRSPSGLRSARVRLLGGPGRGEQVLVRLGGGRFPRLGVPRWPAIGVGSIVVLRGRLEPLAPWERFQARRGVHASLEPASIAATGAARGGAAGALDRARGRAERAIARGLDPAEAALLRGMVLGEDERIAEPVREDFRRSGLAHLLAVSGQNVMLLAALALPLASLLGLPLRSRLLAVLAAVAVYVPLAGGGPSIQRAGVMGAAGLIAALAGRPTSRVYALLLAAAVTLAANPHAAADPGWQLSFAAVMALLAWAAPLAEALRARRCPRPLAEAAAITIAATAGTAPLMALDFGRLSLVSLPANLVAAPAVAPVMWLGMAATAAAQLSGPLGALLAGLATLPLAYVEWVAHATAGLPHAVVPVRVGGAAGVALCYAAMGVAIRRRAVRRTIPALAALAAAVALLLRPASPAPPHGLAVSFLDVGQGDATLVQHGARAVLVDGGPPDGPILARLRRAGVSDIDVLVVTHAQLDHEGGIPAVLAHHRVGLLLDGAAGSPAPAHRALLRLARARGVRVLAPDAGELLRAGPLAIRVLWPHREPAALHAGADPNQRAVVARVSDGAFDLLLTADAESDVTAPLEPGPVEALKVAHHGSADPGLGALLRRLRPEVAAIEVGRRNPYGHPDPTTLRQLRAVPHVYRTDRDGTIVLTVEGGRLRVRTGR
jgi:competence protein ComEC